MKATHLWITAPFEVVPREFDLADEPGPGQALIVDGFAWAVQNGTPPPVSAEDGRAALEIALAAYQSGQEQRPVILR